MILTDCSALRAALHKFDDENQRFSISLIPQSSKHSESAKFDQKSVKFATSSCFGGSQSHESDRKRSIHDLLTLVSSYDMVC